MLIAGLIIPDENIEICPEAYETQSVKDYLESCDNLKMFTVLLNSHDMLENLDGEGDWTVMAPVNEAFTDLKTDRLEEFMGDERLQHSVLIRHINRLASPHIGDEVRVSQMRVIDEEGQTVVLGMTEFEVRNISLANGTVHIVRDLIWPEGRRERN